MKTSDLQEDGDVNEEVECRLSVTLLQPPATSSLQSHSQDHTPLDRVAPHLWNKLPPTSRVPYRSGASSSSNSSQLSRSDAVERFPLSS